MNNAVKAVKAVMTHAREVNVIHTITNKVFITIPLYFEKQMVFQSARIECGELIIEGKLNAPSPKKPLSGECGPNDCS